jgi:predicted transcriptional regulator
MAFQIEYKEVTTKSVERRFDKEQNEFFLKNNGSQSSAETRIELMSEYIEALHNEIDKLINNQK